MNFRVLVYAGAAVACITVFSPAQQAMKWLGSDGWGLAGEYQQTVGSWSSQLINGVVSQVDTVKPLSEMGTGIQLVIKVNNREEIPVHLGPAWFIRHQDMNLGLNDQVEIKGARTAFNGKPVIIAAEVRRKDRILMLRNDKGEPYWAAWKKR
jgi:hypothetical protein